MMQQFSNNSTSNNFYQKDLNFLAEKMLLEEQIKLDQLEDEYKRKSKVLKENINILIKRVTV